MKNNIIEKLHNLLLLDSPEEPKVSYLMIQIRKIIDHLGEEGENKYPLLLFYCNWSAHINMDRASARMILDRLSNFIRYDERYLDEEAIGIIGFVKLREELTQFLKDHDLPNIWVSQDYWFKFRASLMKILIDSPLSSSVGSIREFALIHNPDAGWIKGEDMISYRVRFNNGEEDNGNIILFDQGDEYRKKIHEDNLSWFRRFDLKLYLRNKNKNKL